MSAQSTRTLELTCVTLDEHRYLSKMRLRARGLQGTGRRALLRALDWPDSPNNVTHVEGVLHRVKSLIAHARLITVKLDGAAFVL